MTTEIFRCARYRGGQYALCDAASFRRLPIVRILVPPLACTLSGCYRGCLDVPGTGHSASSMVLIVLFRGE
jgi:hypothetical protein